MEVYKRYLPTRSSNLMVIILILSLLFLYILGNLAISKYLVASFWISALVVASQIRKIKANTKLRYRKNIYFWSLYFGIFYILVHIFAGLIGGFGTSPYNHSALGILNNIVHVGIPIIGRELIRSYLVNSSRRKEKIGVFILVGILMTITTFSINRYTSLSSFQELVEFIGGFFLPLLSNNIFASYLVYKGGPLSTIIYQGLLEGFHWLSPILPNLKWIGSTFN